MITAQTPLAFVARENRHPLFRIMLLNQLTVSLRGAMLCPAASEA